MGTEDLARPVAAAKIIATKTLRHKEKDKRNGHKKVKNKGERQKFKKAEERYKALTRIFQSHRGLGAASGRSQNPKHEIRNPK